MKLTKCDECNDIKELIEFKIHKHPPKKIRYMDVKKIIKKYDIKWVPLFKDIYIGNVYIDSYLLNCFFHTIYAYDLLMKQNKLVKVKKNDYNNYYKSYHFDLFVLYYVFLKYKYTYTIEHISKVLYLINKSNWIYYFYAIRYSYKHKYILL
jgi:hypothetical protein